MPVFFLSFWYLSAALQVHKSLSSVSFSGTHANKQCQFPVKTLDLINQKALFRKRAENPKHCVRISVIYLCQGMSVPNGGIEGSPVLPQVSKLPFVSLPTSMHPRGTRFLGAFWGKWGRSKLLLVLGLWDTGWKLLQRESCKFDLFFLSVLWSSWHNQWEMTF